MSQLHTRTFNKYECKITSFSWHLSHLILVTNSTTIVSLSLLLNTCMHDMYTLCSQSIVWLVERQVIEESRLLLSTRWEQRLHDVSQQAESGSNIQYQIWKSNISNFIFTCSVLYVHPRNICQSFLFAQAELMHWIM